MKAGKAYKHDSFKDLAMFVYKCVPGSVGLDLEVSWIIIGVTQDTIIPDKALLYLISSDLYKWKEYSLKANVAINSYLVKD
jgi:hypothetical protein